MQLNEVEKRLRKRKKKKCINDTLFLSDEQFRNTIYERPVGKAC